MDCDDFDLDPDLEKKSATTILLREYLLLSKTLKEIGALAGEGGDEETARHFAQLLMASHQRLIDAGWTEKHEIH